MQQRKIIKNEQYLNFSMLPEFFTVRKRDYEIILENFKQSISSNSNYFFYVLGPTGTGKTMIGKNIINDLRNQYKNIYFLYINCYNKSSYKVAEEIYISIMRDVVKDQKFQSNEVMVLGIPIEDYLKSSFTILQKYGYNLFLVLDDVNNVFIEYDKYVYYALSRIDEVLNEKDLTNLPRSWVLTISQNKNLIQYFQENVKATAQAIPSHILSFKNYELSELVTIVKERSDMSLYENAISLEQCERIAKICFSTNSNLNARFAIQILTDAANMAERLGRERILNADIDVVTQNNENGFVYDKVDRNNLNDLGLPHMMILYATYRLLNFAKGDVNTSQVQKEYDNLVEEYSKKYNNNILLKDHLNISYPTFLKYIKILESYNLIFLQIKHGGKGGSSTEISSPTEITEEYIKELKKILDQKISAFSS
ncbi:MAG: Cdc6/Cdc18 family protein [Thermoplasmata archaeon]